MELARGNIPSHQYKNIVGVKFSPKSSCFRSRERVTTKKFISVFKTVPLISLLSTFQDEEDDPKVVDESEGDDSVEEVDIDYGKVEEVDPVGGVFECSPQPVQRTRLSVASKQDVASETEDDDSIILASGPSTPVNSRFRLRNLVTEKSSSPIKDKPVEKDPISRLTPKTPEDELTDQKPDKSPFDGRAYTVSDVEELKKKLVSQQRKVEGNRRLLNRQVKNLPDKGAKLGEFIRQQTHILQELEEEMKYAMKNRSKEEQDDSVEEVSADGGKVVITDEQKLDMMYRKMKNLNQQLALSRDDGDKRSLMKERDDLSKQILKLEPFVKQKNPFYRPYANTKDAQMHHDGKAKKQVYGPKVVSGQRTMQTLPAPENSGQSLPATAAGLMSEAWQQFRAGLGTSMGIGSSQSQQERLFAQGPAYNQLYGGRMNEARRQEVLSSIKGRIERIKKSNECKPKEADEETDPTGLARGLKLFPHQRQGLAWLIWRESQHPCGGILADDMGLGKTLTLISLILKSRELGMNGKENQERVEGWKDKAKKEFFRSDGTLVVCPASLVGHWEQEVKKRLKPGTLKVLVYHGANRQQTARSLSRFDLVITTYGTLSSEVKSAMTKEEKGTGKLEDLKAANLDEDAKNVHFLNVGWERVILDEAHQVRNPRSLAAQAVCKLRAAKRWAVTGTPIQNKELDLYSLIRFLRVDPFDEYKVWKQWVENKTSLGQSRMNTLVDNLLLRRSKSQISNVTGKAIVELPEKLTVEHPIKLKMEEQKVYDRVFSFSQQAMINYLKTHVENDDNVDSYIRQREQRDSSAKHSFQYNPNQVIRGSNDLNKKVHASDILVLLLRLRQICCHPGLIKSMIDSESKKNDGLEGSVDSDDLVAQMSRMGLEKKGPKENQHSESLEKDLKEEVMSLGNPVFDNFTPSSKIDTLMKELARLKKKQRENPGSHFEKVVIVSQWTSMLNIVKPHISNLGLKTTEINGEFLLESLRGLNIPSGIGIFIWGAIFKYFV